MGPKAPPSLCAKMVLCYWLDLRTQRYLGSGRSGDAPNNFRSRVQTVQMSSELSDELEAAHCRTIPNKPLLYVNPKRMKNIVAVFVAAVLLLPFAAALPMPMPMPAPADGFVPQELQDSATQERLKEMAKLTGIISNLADLHEFDK
ncbi:hypothetical protein B0H65DRAFT_441989 [Neurospora tetraspora]|uniref:Uncharacterized protein n=1 Tax=Neurospora tetraspora TaxID=94610 RepID=A0AAE0JJ19_9PEZI|nr:hypothetical protein B0H65DRAFT_441989 [Neurospora tetraspora]